jgi:RimJ/RimL family protein N-acetyltransferase
MTDFLRSHRLAGIDSAIAFIKTSRLVLRPLRTEDAPDIAAIANDRRIAENTARLPFPYTVAHAQEFIAFVNGGDGELAFVITLPNDRIIGICGIGTVDGRRREVGYWLGVAYWGKGYATEAACALINHAFTALGYDRLESAARVSNVASRRVLEKCGFQWTDVALYRFRAIGSHVPVDRFRLDRSRWASLRPCREVEEVA